MLKQYIVVRTPNIHLFNAIADHCVKERGHRDLSDREGGFSAYKEQTCIRVTGNDWCYANEDYYAKGGAEIISVDEYFKRKWTPRVVIAGRPVNDVTNKGFRVGCKWITWEEVERVMALRPKED